MKVYLIVNKKSRAVSRGFSPDGEPLRVYRNRSQADVAARRLGMKVEVAKIVRPNKEDK